MVLITSKLDYELSEFLSKSVKIVNLTSGLVRSKLTYGGLVPKLTSIQLIFLTVIQTVVENSLHFKLREQS